MDIQQLQNLTLQYRAQLLPGLFNQFAGTVQTGPFTGLKLSPEVCWGDGDTASKLLGLYEDELHSNIRRVLVDGSDLVVNIGAAEGYYACGMALRLGCNVVAVDTMQRARDITAQTAELNNLTVAVRDAVTNEELNSMLVNSKRPVLVIDCEGAEQTLLDPVTVPELAKSRILVESHDCFVPGVTEELVARFEPTHHCTVIQARGKNPWVFKALDKYWDLEKLILVNECRPETAQWIWMEPK